MQGPNQQKSIAKELMRNAPHKGTDQCSIFQFNRRDNNAFSFS